MKKMSVFIGKVLVFTMLMCLLQFQPANAQSAIKLYIDEKQISTDVSPCIINDRTMVPVRVVMEHLGANVEWDGKLRQVNIETDEKNIQLTIDNEYAKVNKESVKLDAAPVIKSDRTIVPIRFVSEELGYNVDWDGTTRSVSIFSPEEEKMIDINNISTVSKRNNTVITVKLEEYVKPQITRMADPYRIVVDLSGTYLMCGDGKDTGDGDYVDKLRWAQHEDYSRLVIETAGYQPYELSQKGESLVITIGNENTKFEESDEEKDDLKDDLDDNQDDETDESDDGDAEDKNDDIANKVKWIDDGKPLKVVIDAGHGGRDSGAVAKDEDDEVILKEKDVTLDVAKRVEELLKNDNIEVIMTRTKDVYEGSTTMENLLSRCRVANDANAAMFVSIHINSFVDDTATGTEVCYTSESEGILGVTSLKIAKNILSPLVDATTLRDRGTFDRPKLVVLKYTAMPAVLLELGFISNPEDRKILEDDDKLDDIAYAIKDGIVKSLNQMEKNRK